jgi:hypothetical protein
MCVKIDICTDSDLWWQWPNDYMYEAIIILIYIENTLIDDYDQVYFGP